jgi:putative ABC transport system permease protein
VVGVMARESWYRFRSTFRRRWTGYLTLVVLLGLLGGVALAAIAGARRTQSSFPTYLASTNPGDVQIFTEFDPISNVGDSFGVDQAVARVPGVAKSVVVVGFDGTLRVLGNAGAGGVPGQAPPSVEGSPNGEYFSSDTVTVLQGRRADPTRPDEIMMSAGAAAQYGLRVGSVLPVAFYTTSAVNAAPGGNVQQPPHRIVRLSLVGIIEWSPQVVQDDDEALGDQLAVLTPALTKQLQTCCAYYSYVSLHLRNSAQVGTVVAAVNKVVPNLGPAAGWQTNGPVVAKAERAIRPESIAIGVFGGIAVLATIIICAQVISRLIRRDNSERSVVRALGAGPAMVLADGLLGPLVAVVAGALLATAVAAMLSPLTPFGPVRGVYPDTGLSLDWTVLGFGTLLFVVVLWAVAGVVAARTAPDRRGVGELVPRRASALEETAARAGLSPSALLGVRSALGRGSGSRRDAAPVRSALLGAVLAVVVIVTSVTFGSSLNALVSQPSLYGWNWDYALLSGFSAAENLPAAETSILLDHDPVVSHWAGVYFESVALDGKEVPVLAMRPGSAVYPSVLSGHPLQGESQIVLGPTTLAALGAHVGSRVIAEGDGHHEALTVVGTATLPTIGGSGQPTLQMGTGAVMSSTLFSATDLNQQGSPVAGPMAAFVAIRPGVSQDAALRSLDRIAAVLNRKSDPNAPIGGVVSALRPAEIADSHTISATPTLLAAVLATGAVVALALTLVASVRQRRREFAVLKALGFSQRQLAASIAWQSSVAAVVGVVLGVPIGIALGRWLWTLFADSISAVPHPSVPLGTLAIVVVGALVFANVISLIPGRLAARTSTAALLRAE